MEGKELSVKGECRVLVLQDAPPPSPQLFRLAQGTASATAPKRGGELPRGEICAGGEGEGEEESH